MRSSLTSSTWQAARTVQPAWVAWQSKSSSPDLVAAPTRGGTRPLSPNALFPPPAPAGRPAPSAPHPAGPPPPVPLPDLVLLQRCKDPLGTPAKPVAATLLLGHDQTLLLGSATRADVV